MKNNDHGKFFALPNEIFLLGLNSGELAVYCYLQRCKNKRTHQCWPSTKTIGQAVSMSENTVRKYIRRLEERGLITTEPTEVITKSSGRRNGNLLFTLLPIQNAIDQFHERQMSALEQAAAQQRAQRQAEKSGVEFVPPDKEQSA